MPRDLDMICPGCINAPIYPHPNVWCSDIENCACTECFDPEPYGWDIGDHPWNIGDKPNAS